ncbi:hypothetical protein [Streptomyces sp. NBC_00503]|uniref:hypothetical protein n=1 Tax=Streptomyces sp. NBC_00503 TaxID=2903659 RepID=UPI002E7FD33D|nr:hypothetical protein [Streptomyces sp. NBC_00503]WUD79145.1 hypothetical protein OG490_00240 [Streptomyces sp. NBC_00503]
MRKGFPLCVVGYLLVFVAGWSVATALIPPEAGQSFWEAYSDNWGFISLVLPLVGGVSLFLLLLLYICGRSLSPGGFKAWAVGLLLLPPAPFVLTAAGGWALLALMATQVLFALAVMPVEDDTHR